MRRYPKSRKKGRTLSLQSEYELGPMFTKFGRKEHGQGNPKRKTRQGVKFQTDLKKIESDPRFSRTFRRQTRDNHDFRSASMPRPRELKVHNTDIDNEVYRKAPIKNSGEEGRWDCIENPKASRRATKKHRRKQSGQFHHHSKMYRGEEGVSANGNYKGEELRMDKKGRMYVIHNQEKIYIHSKEFKGPSPQVSAVLPEPRQREHQSISNSNAHTKNNPISKVVEEDFRSFRPGYQNHYPRSAKDEPIPSENWNGVDISENRPNSSSKRHYVGRKPKSKSKRTTSKSSRVETANEKWERRKLSARKKVRNRLSKKMAEKGVTRDNFDINIKSDNRELRRLEKLKRQQYLQNESHSKAEEMPMEGKRKSKKKKKKVRKSRFSEAGKSPGHHRFNSTVSEGPRGWKKKRHHSHNQNKLSKAAVKKQLIRDLETPKPQKSPRNTIKASSPRFNNTKIEETPERENVLVEVSPNEDGANANKWALMLQSSQDDYESENGAECRDKMAPADYPGLMYEEKVRETTPDEADYHLKGWQCSWDKYDGSQGSGPETNIGIEKPSGHWDYTNIEDLDEAVKQHKVKKNKEKLLKGRSTKSRKQVIGSIRQSPEQDISPLPLEKAPRRFWPESFSQQDIPGAFDNTHDKSVTNTKWRILE